MSWHNQNTGGFLRTSVEAQDNAWMVYNTLRSLGWLVNPICAMLGNVEHESAYNPWRWQSDIVLAMNSAQIGVLCGGNTAHAYGLCQQDPAAKYIYRPYSQALPDFQPNFSDRPGGANDGTAQLQYLHWICQNGDPDCGSNEWLPGASATYGMQYNDFITDTAHTINFLTHTFFWCYERGTWSDTRVTAAQYWYDFFQGTPPEPPTPIPPTTAEICAMYIALKKRKNIGIYERRWYKK